MRGPTTRRSRSHSVIDLAHNFGLTVVAEGVETQAQAERLHQMTCDIGQGYLWSPPVPAHELPPKMQFIDTTRHTSLRRR